MDIGLILEIVKYALLVLFGGLAIYYNTNAKLNKKVDEYIDKAEVKYNDATKAGGEKFEWVVTKLYGFVPAIMKPFITRDMVGAIVQGAFDSIESYGKQQLDKLSDKVIDKK